MNPPPPFPLPPGDPARLLEALVRASGEGMIVTAPDGSILWVNDAFTDITGYDADEAHGQNPRMLKSDHHDAAFYEALWSRLIEEGVWEGEIWNRRKSGEAYPERLSIRAIRDASGRLAGYVGVFTDITDQKSHKEVLLHEAYHDPLTGLPNRHLFHDRLGMALRKSQLGGNPVGVICLDLDRFKTINDSLGHATGDIILTEVGYRLSKLLRQADTLSRFGGDDFYMLLTELRDPEDAAHVAGRILTCLADPVETLGEELHVTASIGVTISPSDGTDPAQLVRNAEMAMYRAKEAGRNNFNFFTEDLGNRVLKGLKLENDLRKALAREEFVLYYQPRVDVLTGTVRGMEALVRWIPAGGVPVSPGEFIPLAEETGLILALGDWILEEACRQTKLWLDEGLGDLKVAVNLSPRQIEQPGLAAKVLAVLERTGLPASRLEVEVTETVFLKGFAEARKTLSSLAAAGITVALDDFGTGYSSLTYLKQLPISTLKIDKSFVDGLPQDKDDAAIVTSVVSIAANLGLAVVAEGVETMAQLEFLRSLSCCDGFQGYLYAKPLPPREFAALLSRGDVLLPHGDAA
ncbi:putative bifunctional diguanylate cyclase/phosphodiesterase [Fundidesulfovibrio terrae]|uniref:putative bifunctional diguanylate cyclase/phosphodiesterase n=1 Tax=Fundidesulfovibrio terrae TaxID=2922866 RepID=UPI0024356BF4|nr:GGDEF and EAL domain-containing protein [Fundidesulfovibrio terrae]